MVKLVSKIGMSLAAAISLTTSAYALNSDEKLFVDTYVVTRFVLVVCPGYVSDDDTPMKLADKMGVEGAKIWDAARAALLAKMDQPYERSDLIPEVTREVTAAMNDNAEQIANGRVCSLVPSFVKVGWLKRK